VTVGDGLTLAGATLTSQSTVNGGRLTLANGTPVTTSDVTAATTIYWSPYHSGTITLWDGSALRTLVSSDVSLAIGTLTSGKNYDVFGFLNSGALALEVGPAWTSDTARSVGIAWANGLLTKSGDATRRYLGTFRTTSSTTTEDSAAKRFIFNAANRVARTLLRVESTSSWMYTTPTWRQANGSTANAVEVVRGLDQDSMDLSVTATWNANNTPKTAAVGIGVDSTTTPTVMPRAGSSGTPAAVYSYSQSNSRYVGCPGLGYHALYWLEYSETGGTTTWFGNAALPSPYYILSGMSGACWA